MSSNSFNYTGSPQAIFESSDVANLRVNDLIYPINVRDEYPLIKLENVSNEIIVNTFSININTKSRIAILGANRSGKTNLIKLMYLLIKHCHWDLLAKIIYMNY